MLQWYKCGAAYFYCGLQFYVELADKTISYLLDNMKDVLKIITCA